MGRLETLCLKSVAGLSPSRQPAGHAGRSGLATEPRKGKRWP